LFRLLNGWARPKGGVVVRPLEDPDDVRQRGHYNYEQRDKSRLGVLSDSVAKVKEKVWVHAILSDGLKPVQSAPVRDVLKQVNHKDKPKEHASHQEVGQPIINCDILCLISSPVGLSPFNQDDLSVRPRLN
jgi:phage-related protein